MKPRPPTVPRTKRNQVFKENALDSRESALHHRSSGGWSILHAPTCIAIVSFAIWAYLYYGLPRSAIPSHLLGHRLIWQEDLISQETAVELRRLMKTMKKFPSNIAADLKTSASLANSNNEDIGESQPMQADGSCSHPFLVPNVKRTKCVLPGRIDVGMHFILSGGVDGIREEYDKMIHRVTSFGRYNFYSDGIGKYPVVKDLFDNPSFVGLGIEVCPPDKQYLDPFQFNFIVQIPGQTVATHLDAPYFHGANRFHFPQWLLVCMTFSGLFQDRFIDQVQVVAYLHEWKPSRADAGDFIYYQKDSADFDIISAQPLSGSGIDGSKSVHAARTYRPDAYPPALDKDKDSALVYQGFDRWDVISGDDVVGSYNSSQLRTSIVYRARCFESKDAADDYNDKLTDAQSDDMLKLDDVLNTFMADLIKKGFLRESERETISRLDLSLLIIKTYVQYPLPNRRTRLVPYNYCALPRLYPWLNLFTQWIC